MIQLTAINNNKGTAVLKIRMPVMRSAMGRMAIHLDDVKVLLATLTQDNMSELGDIVNELHRCDLHTCFHALARYEQWVQGVRA